MRAKLKIKLTVPVILEVETEWDKQSCQAVIVKSKISDETLVSPRMVYESMKGSDYSSLDQKARGEFSSLFDAMCESFRGKPTDQLPEDEIRGIPLHPTEWSKCMKLLYGAYITVPVSRVCEAVKDLTSKIVIEPVLGRIPTVYIWNVFPEDDVLDRIAARAGEMMKSPQIDRLEEGCLRLRWRSQ